MDLATGHLHGRVRRGMHAWAAGWNYDASAHVSPEDFDGMKQAGRRIMEGAASYTHDA